MKKTDEIIEIRVLIGKQGRHYIARSVDVEIVAQSKSKEDLPALFLATYLSTFRAYQKAGLDISKHHPKAPKEIRALFEEGFKTIFPDKKLDHTLVRSDARVIAGAAK